jgi:protein-S-isoprenylcysteine O-methyltransferase Ste14
MNAASPPQTQHSQHDPDAIARVGGWLFARRTLVPLPIVAGLLLFPATPAHPALQWAGAILVTAGELVRLWAVRHIGVISRTRSDRLGPLVASGPFGLVRNPLYIGNIAIWVGFALSARLPYMAPIVFVALALTYHAIVRWEERLLESRLGEPYHRYAAQVPRWWPGRLKDSPADRVDSRKLFSWKHTIFSERGTLIAIAIGYGLLYVKDLG